MSVSNSTIASRPIPRQLTRLQIADNSDVISLVQAVNGGTVFVWGVFLWVKGVTELTFRSGESVICGPLGGGEGSSPYVITLPTPVGRPIDDQAFPYFQTVEGEALSLGNSEEVEITGYIDVEQTAT